MIVDKWLSGATTVLEQTSSTPRLDAEVLLCHVLKKDRSWALAHSDELLPKDSIQALNNLLRRRKNHEPIAYILGSCEFYGREFIVDRHVLVPRPESEAIIDLLKQQREIDLAVDVGTGSGALAITAKLELPKAKVYAIDIDKKALSVAKENSKILKADIKFMKSDLLGSVPNSLFQILGSVFLCNLPYVPNGYAVNEPAKHEPKLALFGGEDGLDLYRRLFKQLKDTRGTVITESLLSQHSELKKIAEETGFKQTEEQDLIQVFERP